MELGLAYKDVLPSDHRQALAKAAGILVDTTLEDLETSGEPDWSADNWFIGGLLPSRYKLRYTPGFARKFLYCLLTVIWKLGQPEPVPLSCVAEELAAHVLIREAESILEEWGASADFNIFEDTVFEDLDFEFLYHGVYDGVEISDVGEELGIANLAFGDWFKQFGSADSADYPAVHPLAQNDEGTQGP